MGVWPGETTPESSTAIPGRIQRIERHILIYWGIAALLGAIFIPTWILNWNVAATFERLWLIIYLVISWSISQAVYIIVARHDDRPIHWGSAIFFSLLNGVCETFAFALVYWIGEVIGKALAALLLPSAINIAGFIMGIVLFIIYGGLIHGLFWVKLLPPHFDNSPLSRSLRNIRPLIEIGLVSGWAMCFWITRDIWTVVFFHILVDLILMLRVRPPIFTDERM